jgi:hypothetical protein
MNDMLDLIFLFGEELSVLALIAGAVLSLMASDSVQSVFRAVRQEGGTPVVLRERHRPNPIDHPQSDA